MRAKHESTREYRNESTWREHCDRKVKQYEKRQRELVAESAEVQHKLDRYRNYNSPD